MKIKVEFTKNARTSFRGPYNKGDAWDTYFHVARCFERSNPKLRAWQIHVLWLHVSMWWTAKSEMEHALNDPQ